MSGHRAPSGRQKAVERGSAVRTAGERPPRAVRSARARTRLQQTRMTRRADRRRGARGPGAAADGGAESPHAAAGRDGSLSQSGAARSPSAFGERSRRPAGGRHRGAATEPGHWSPPKSRRRRAGGGQRATRRDHARRRSWRRARRRRGGRPAHTRCREVGSPSSTAATASDLFRWPSALGRTEVWQWCPLPCR